MKRSVVTGIFVILSLFYGFWVTRSGTFTWDSSIHLEQGKWLLDRYLGRNWVPSEPIVTRYGPLWPLILETLDRFVFFPLQDRIWVYHALTAAFLPLGLLGLWQMLRRVGYSASTCLLVSSLLLGCIRWVGHSLVNLKDFSAATIYLLSTLALWLLLSGDRAKQQRQAPSWRLIFFVAAVATAPLLARFPLNFHLLAAGAWFVLAGRTRIGLKSGSRLVLAAVICMVVLWPTLWTSTPRQWADMFRIFTGFQNMTFVRVLGVDVQASRLPIWYIFVWLPIMVTPWVLASLFGAAIYACVDHKRMRTHPETSLRAVSFVLPWKKKTISLTLPAWIALFFALPILAFVFKRPTLFDEERHVLFVFPLVLVWAGLALDRLADRTKIALAVLGMAFSIPSYVSWGRYMYVYKTPLISDQMAAGFMGDYWGTCIPLAITELDKQVDKPVSVQTIGPWSVVEYQASRLKKLVFLPSQDGAPPPAYRLVLYRTHWQGAWDTDPALWKSIWSDSMPRGGKACELFSLR